MRRENKTALKIKLILMTALLLVLYIGYPSTSHAASPWTYDDTQGFSPATPIKDVRLSPQEMMIEEETPDNQLIFKNFQEEPSLPYDLPTPCTGENCDANHTDHHKPEPPPIGGEIFTPISTGFEPVSSFYTWPFSPTVRLSSLWPSGETTLCSGMLIDAQHMLTAGRCIYTHQAQYCSPGDESCWVEDLVITPAYDQGEALLGESGFKTILTWTDWTIREDTNYDLAAVELRYPLGAYIGWLGFGFDNNEAFFLDNAFTSTFYPFMDPYDGEQMFGSIGTITNLTEHQLSFGDIGYYGQDGASLNYSSSFAAVYGVHSHSDTPGTQSYTRLTYDKFEAIRVFIDQGRPKYLGDLAAFDLHAKPVSAFPGQKITELNFFVHNYSDSEIESRDYTATIYLSVDDDITEEDQVLGVYTFSRAFAPNTGERFSVPISLGVKLPVEMRSPEPLGMTYHIGVILNPDDDFNPENNRSNYLQTQPIWIYNSETRQFNIPIFFQ